MEKISTEIFLSSLFCLGYDRVDSLLYTYLLEQLFTDEQKSSQFEFVAQKFSKLFVDYVKYDGQIYQLKYNYTIDTDISPIEDYHWSLGSALTKNEKLMNCLRNVDLKPIVIEKIKRIGIERIEECNYLFSNKEKETIYNLFAINSNKSKKRSIVNDSFEIEGIIQDIRKRKALLFPKG